MRPVGVPDHERHPLDPGVGDVYSTACGCRRDFYACVDPDDVTDHCHCDYHDGHYGCEWGNVEFIRRLTQGWRENHKQLAARGVAHALGYQEDPSDMPEEWFRSLPAREEVWSGDETEIASFVILPGRSDVLHDSGYRRMGFAALCYDRPAFRFGGSSDNISFDGIGGDKGDFNKDANSGPHWQIECLPGSGLLNVWCRGRIGIESHILSTFEPLARRRG